MSFPKLWLTMSVAVFLGLGLGLGIAFTREALDTTVRSPRDLIRVRLRCRLCGRARAVYRKFGICRICFRDMANKGLIPGVQKASW